MTFTIKLTTPSPTNWPQAPFLIDKDDDGDSSFHHHSTPDGQQFIQVLCSTHLAQGGVIIKQVAYFRRENSSRVRVFDGAWEHLSRDGQPKCHVRSMFKNIRNWQGVELRNGVITADQMDMRLITCWRPRPWSNFWWNDFYRNAFYPR